MKRCTKCGVLKPESAFGKREKTRGGLFSQCCLCVADITFERRQKDPEKYRQKRRAYRSRPEIAVKYKTGGSYKPTLTQQRAYGLVAYYKRRGVIKAKPCAICGATKTEAHHPNHRYPLDIVWLCRRHHQRLHKGHIKLPPKAL